MRLKKMETKISNTRMKALNVQSLVIALIVVGAVTGGNLWIHRGDPLLGYIRYTRYGISFDYSSEMSLRESDLGGFGSATDSGGNVQVTYPGADRLEQYGVTWVEPKVMPTYMDPTPAYALDFLFEMIAIGGTQITDRSDYMTTTIDNHEVIYQTFGVLNNDFTIPGMIGAWYCEETNRFLVLYLIYVPDFENIEVPYEGLEQMWFDYVDALTCHGIPS
jgi:hypothetical protein